MENKKDIGRIISELAAVHVELWHEEDKARVPDDAQVAKAKRRIDQLNQKRNDLVEQIDVIVVGNAASPAKGKKRG